MSRRKLLLVFLLLAAARIVIFAIPAIAGDELPLDPGDASIIPEILASLI